MTSISSLIAFLSYAIVLCGIIPLFPWLTLVPRLALVVGMAAGIWQNRKGAWPLKNWMVNASTVPIFLFYANQYSRTNPLQPVVNVLALLLAVRLLGEKNSRNYQQIQALSLFCLASSSLFDLSPLFLLYLILMLLMVAVSLVLLTFHSHDSRMLLSRHALRRVLSASLLLPLASLPLLVFFFPLLPRTPFPLWNFQATPTSRQTGMSDKVEPGRSASVGEARVTAFRAELPHQKQQQLYWRGTVFNSLVGNRWERDLQVPAERLLYSGPRVEQTIYPEPGINRSLFALDSPVVINYQRFKRYPDGVYEMLFASSKRQSYGAASVINGVLPVAGEIDRSFYLKLPSSVPVRIKSLALDIRQRGTGDIRRLELIGDYFNAGNYHYTTNDLPTGEHALELFLFEKRQGNCEFFASSFAVLARAAGIPTRLVGGYLGGEYNDLGGYYIVTENMAHVWVEVFIEGKGWIRIDPSSYAKNANALWGDRPRRDLMLRLRMAVDSLNHAWNRSIITYNFESQVDIARNAAKRLQGLRTGKAPRVVVAYALTAMTAGAIIFLLMRYNVHISTREERLLRRFYRRVELDCGVKVQRGYQGLFEIAKATGNDSVSEFAEIYAGALYRDRRLTKDELERLNRLLAKGFKQVA